MSSSKKFSLIETMIKNGKSNGKKLNKSSYFYVSAINEIYREPSLLNQRVIDMFLLLALNEDDL